MSAGSLVIGGTRNLGPELVLALLERGDHVAVLNRGVTPDDLPPEVERLRADRSDPHSLTAALGKSSFELVVDTTLYNGPDAEATVRLLDARVGRYVFWSTGQVYLVRRGLGTGDSGLVRPEGFVERDYHGPVMPAPPPGTPDHDQWRYGVEKRAAEDALREGFERRGFPFVSLRMPMINSRRDHYRRLAAYLPRLREGRAILVPDDQDTIALRHVYGRDVIAATLLAGDPAVPAGTCANISQDETLRLEEMLAIAGEALGVGVRVERRPRAELDAARYLPAGSPWSGRWMSVLDNTLSKSSLRMSYTPVREYVTRLVSELVA